MHDQRKTYSSISFPTIPDHQNSSENYADFISVLAMKHPWPSSWIILIASSKQIYFPV